MDVDVAGVLFDKDGTLIDFRGTWDGFALGLIAELAPDPSDAARLAKAMRFDLSAGTFRPDSPIIAGTMREAAECVVAGLDDRDVGEVEMLMRHRAAEAAMAPVVPLGPLCDVLREAGLKLGVATNDSEEVALANLDTMRIREKFHYVAGYDSGYGGKPDPGMITAFCDQMGIAPQACLMVGDSTHDLIAAARAGVRPVAVLTGTAGEAELAPYAEVVLPDIGHLPDWLGP